MYGGTLKFSDILNVIKIMRAFFNILSFKHPQNWTMNIGKNLLSLKKYS
jgi:hypothetical protein